MVSKTLVPSISPFLRCTFFRTNTIFLLLRPSICVCLCASFGRVNSANFAKLENNHRFCYSILMSPSLTLFCILRKKQLWTWAIPLSLYVFFCLHSILSLLHILLANFHIHFNTGSIKIWIWFCRRWREIIVIIALPQMEKSERTLGWHFRAHNTIYEAQIIINEFIGDDS